MSRALSTPRPPGCVAGQPRTVPPRPADASRAARIAGGALQRWPCRVRRGARCRPNRPRPELQPITGGGEEFSGRTWAQAAPSHPRAPAPHGSARARVRTHPYSPKPLSPKPRCASPGARAPPSARRGKGDEIGSPRVRALGWVGLGAARLQAARGWGRLECAVTRISTRERSQGPPSNVTLACIYV